MINAVAEETFTPTSKAALLELRTTPAGSVNSLVRLVILGSGKVGIGTTDPKELLSIAANSINFHDGGSKAIGFKTYWEPAGGAWTRVSDATYGGLLGSVESRRGAVA